MTLPSPTLANLLISPRQSDFLLPLSSPSSLSPQDGITPRATNQPSLTLGHLPSASIFYSQSHSAESKSTTLPTSADSTRTTFSSVSSHSNSNGVGNGGMRSAKLMEESVAAQAQRTPGGSLVIGSEIFGFGTRSSSISNGSNSLSNGSVATRDRWGEGGELLSPPLSTYRSNGSNNHSLVGSPSSGSGELSGYGMSTWPHEFEQAISQHSNGSGKSNGHVFESDRSNAPERHSVSGDFNLSTLPTTHPSIRSYNSSTDTHSVHQSLHKLSHLDDVSERHYLSSRPNIGRSKSGTAADYSTTPIHHEDDSNKNSGFPYGLESLPSTTHHQQRVLPVPQSSYYDPYSSTTSATTVTPITTSLHHQALLNQDELNFGMDNLTIHHQPARHSISTEYQRSNTISSYHPVPQRSASIAPTSSAFPGHLDPSSFGHSGGHGSESSSEYYRRGSSTSSGPADLRSRDSGSHSQSWALPLLGHSHPQSHSHSHSHTSQSSPVEYSAHSSRRPSGATSTYSPAMSQHSHLYNPPPTSSASSLGIFGISPTEIVGGGASNFNSSSNPHHRAMLRGSSRSDYSPHHNVPAPLPSGFMHQPPPFMPPHSSLFPPSTTTSNRGYASSNGSGGRGAYEDTNGGSNGGGGGGGNGGGTRVMRSPLLEEFRTNRHRSWELFDLQHHIVEFSGDQLGSRHIQQKLDTATAEERQLVFDEIRSNLLQLSTDVFANYVIQKLFEQGTQMQKTAMANILEGHVLALSLQMYGCRVVQKALEYVLVDQQVRLIRELDGHVLKCARDAQSNHVVQRALERVPSDQLIFITDACIGQVQALATHPYGCRVLQRIFENCPSSQTRVLLDDLHRYTQNLIQDQYGNYVIQWIVEKGDRADRALVISKVCGQLLMLAQQKFASNVIEKCIIYAEDGDRRRLVDEVLSDSDTGESTVGLMLSHPYANYVFQKILVTTGGMQKEALVAQTTAQLSHLRKFSTSYSKHLITIEKLLISERARGA